MEKDNPTLYKKIYIWDCLITHKKDKNFAIRKVDITISEYENEPVTEPSEFHKKIALRYRGIDTTLVKFEMDKYIFSWTKKKLLMDEKTTTDITRHITKK